MAVDSTTNEMLSTLLDSHDFFVYSTHQFDVKFSVTVITNVLLPEISVGLFLFVYHKISYSNLVGMTLFADTQITQKIAFLD